MPFWEEIETAVCGMQAEKEDDFEVGRARLNVLANVFSNYTTLCNTVNTPYSELESSQQGRNLT